MDSIKSKTSMLHFSEAHFEKTLTALKNTQESIQSLSHWCLQNKQHHKKIVNCWFKVIKKVKMECRLTLFYLANDVIQYSKRKNQDFVNTWALCLQRAVTLVRDDKVKPNIQRIFKIWEDRGIFDEAFIADLTGLLESPKGVSSDTAKLVAEFQPMKLVDKIRSCKILEDDTDLKLSILKDSSLELTDVDALRNNLKDRRHGADHVSEVEEGIKKMEAYVLSLSEEIKDRAKLIEFLEQGNVFYEHQKGEAKIVVSAYRNFGTRVKNLKRKLDELIPTLGSPVPSPDINAPSPEGSDAELELPEISHTSTPTVTNTIGTAGNSYEIPDSHPVHSLLQSGSQPLGMGSFLGAAGMPFDLMGNFFKETNFNNDTKKAVAIANNASSREGKPIEVINSRSNSNPPEELNVTQFLKSLGHQSKPKVESPVSSIPGLGSVQPVPSPANCVDVKPKVPSQQYGQEDAFNLYTMFSTPPPPPPAERVSSTPVTPPTTSLHPPIVSPETFLQDTNRWSGNYNESTWENKTTPKFPPWIEADNDWERDSPKEWEMDTSIDNSKMLDDTPLSPPMFEKEGFNDPVEYDDRSGMVAEDVDHRTLSQHASGGRQGKKDIDHRNLISLTGSPASHEKHHTQSKKPGWNKYEAPRKDLDLRIIPSSSVRPSESLTQIKTDQDYRHMASSSHQTLISLPKTSDKTGVGVSDNVESVDMEMSDEENDTTQHSDSRQTSNTRKQHSSRYNDSSSHNKVSRNNTQNNGAQQRSAPNIPPKPLLSSNFKPLLPDLVPSPGTNPVQSNKYPLLPTPSSVISSPAATPAKPVIPSLLQTPVQLSSREKEDAPVNETENGNSDNWDADDWDNQCFDERMQSSSDPFDEESSQHQRGGRGSPRIPPHRENHNSNYVSPRGRKFQNSQFHYSSNSSGFKSRGFRGGGSYRPYRGQRRGNFNRW